MLYSDCNKNVIIMFVNCFCPLLSSWIIFTLACARCQIYTPRLWRNLCSDGLPLSMLKQFYQGKRGPLKLFDSSWTVYSPALDWRVVVVWCLAHLQLVVYFEARFYLPCLNKLQSTIMSANYLKVAYSLKHRLYSVDGSCLISMSSAKSLAKLRLSTKLKG